MKGYEAYTLKTFDNIIRDMRTQKIVEVDNRESLLNHPERDSIINLKYNGSEMLVEGDLPSSGALKTIEFFDGKLGACEAIPNGVEVLIFNQYNSGITPVSKYPSSVNTIINARFNEESVIPSNIAAISILHCPRFDQGAFKLPNTIQRLTINIATGFGAGTIGVRAEHFKSIPDNVTALNVESFTFDGVNECVLPSGLKELAITYGTMINLHKVNQSNLFDFSVIVPKGVETLFIESYNHISASSNLSQCASLKKVVLTYRDIFGNIDKTFDKASLLPSSATELVLN